LANGGAAFWYHMTGIAGNESASPTEKPKVFSFLYLMDSTGKQREFVKELKEAISLQTIHFLDQGVSCWVPGTGGGLYGIRSDGVVLHDGKPFWPKVRFDSLRPAPDERHLWAVSSEKGVFAIRPDGTPANGGAPLLAENKPQKVYACGNGRALVVARGGDLYLVDLEGEVRQRPLLDQGSLRQTGIQGIVPVGNSMWVAGRDQKVHVVRVDGTRARVIAVPEARVLKPARDFGPNDEDHQDAFDQAAVRRSILPLDDRNAFIASAEALFLADMGGKAKRLPLRLIDGAAIWGLRSDARKRYCWIALTGPLLYALARDGTVFTAGRESIPVARGVQPEPAGDGKHAWLPTRLRGQSPPCVVGIVDDTEDLGKATLTFAGKAPPAGREHLTLGSKGAVHLRADPTSSPWSFALDWPGQESARAIGATVTVDVYDGKELIAHAAGELAEGSLAPVWKKPHEWDRPYRVVLTYRDDFGSNVAVTWPEVRFDVPLWQRRWLRTVVLATLLVALTTALLRLRITDSTVQNWLPLGAWLAGGGLASIPQAQETFGIDGVLLGGILAGAMVLALPLGLTWPAAFRDLARAEPFRRLAPYALLIPRLRRRLFAEYVSELRQTLEDACTVANREEYVDIPADAQSRLADKKLAALLWKGPEGELKVPAEEIKNLLTASPPAHVLVESPGGRGKSALLRQAVRLLLDAFEQNPNGPLPVLCDVKKGEDDFTEMARRGLARHLVAADSLGWYLRNGYFVLVFDGLSETPLDPAALRTFVRGEYGESTGLLLTSRPQATYREAVQASPRWVLLEPRRLDDTTLPAFVTNYAKADAKVLNRPPTALSPQLQSACRGGDGTYLQILVRLAVRFSGDGDTTVADLYRRTFTGLLRASQSEQASADLLDEAGKVSVETYWSNGYRKLAYAQAPAARKVVLGKLLAANILMPAARERPGEDPREVQFFHDSMQSYLTAVGLFKKHGDEEDWGFLFSLAGGGRPEVPRVAVGPPHGGGVGTVPDVSCRVQARREGKRQSHSAPARLDHQARRPPAQG
jgi:hypothetical protein